MKSYKPFVSSQHSSSGVLPQTQKIIPAQIVHALIFSAILFPFIRLPSSIPDVRPEFLITLAGWGSVLLGALVAKRRVRIRRLPTYKWFLLFGISILLSMTYAVWFKGEPLIGRDFWEVVKVLLYLSLFTLVATRNICSNQIKQYYRFALVVLALSACFGFLQYINFAGINQFISPYYAPTQIRGLVVHKRITGTTPNPNEFGGLMVLASALALSGGLFFRERRMRMLSWVMLPIYGLALVLTLSRTSLIALVLTGMAVMILFLRRKSLKGKYKRILKLAILLAVVGIFILQFLPQKALYRYSQLAQFTQATSWQGRVEKWEANFSIWLQSPWLGWGPGKSNMSTTVDNEWLLLLRRYGVVGVLVFGGLFGSLFSGLGRIGKNTLEPAVVALTVALRGTFVGYMLYMALAPVYHSLQLMPIFLLFLGLAYSQWKPKPQRFEGEKL